MSYPDHREGLIYNHISDTQQGYRPHFTDNWATRAAEDINRLAAFTDAHVHTGDCIEWYTPLPEDEKYIEFRNRVLQTGKPYLDTPGNHDLSTYNQDAPRKSRTANEWASEVPKRTVANKVMLVGDTGAVIGISPDNWPWSLAANTYVDPDPLTPFILNWLDEQLALLKGRRVWFASHALPSTQLSDTPRFDGTLKNWDDIQALVAAHQNVVGWFSGHWHIDTADPRSVRSIPVGGRRIWGVNAPSSTGLFPGTTPTQHQFKRTAGSLYVTDTGSDLLVRWRDHLRGEWVAPFGKSVMRYKHA